jgi:hypothetical protein
MRQPDSGATEGRSSDRPGTRTTDRGRVRTLRRLSLLAAGLIAIALWPAATASAQEPPGTSDLTSGWKIQSSAVATDSGAAVSDPGYSTDGWLPISQPETLMAGLVENGRYPNIFFSDNLAKVPADQFDVNWWYRDEVQIHPRAGQHTFLIMNGVLSRANLWVNGTKVADQSELQGAYSQFEYDITPYVRDGANAIALDVFKNDSSNSGYLTLNMVDWNPEPPDNWTGLQFAPQLAQDGAISVRNAHVIEDNSPDLQSSDITVKADLRNNTDTAQSTAFSGSITGHGSQIQFTKLVTVPAGSTTAVELTPADYPQLHIEHPAVWWPAQMGDQPLYHLAVSAAVEGAESDRFSEDFGIRTVTSHLTDPVPGTFGESGYRQFEINGVPFVVRGGGWSQDLFLRYSPQNIRDQLSYIKNMGLNAIRFEGNFPPDDMFQQMDREGILAMPAGSAATSGSSARAAGATRSRRTPRTRRSTSPSGCEITPACSPSTRAPTTSPTLRRRRSTWTPSARPTGRRRRWRLPSTSRRRSSAPRDRRRAPTTTPRPATGGTRGRR